MFRSAGIAEIIRSHQKDDSFLHYLRSSLADIVQRLFGPRVWILWRNHLDVASDILYFILTTGTDLQTVGEEYVNIIQTDGSLRALPTKWRRACMIALQICAPYLFHSALKRFEHQLRTSGSLRLHSSTREAILNVLPVIRKAVTVIHRLHLATFYINGIFYHLAKRITGIHYVQYMTKDWRVNSSSAFQILGYLSVTQLLFSFVLSIFTLLEAFKAPQSTLEERETMTRSMPAVLPREKCPLCLGRRQRSTLTPCGHLYCWACIHEWCLSKQECPLCRDRFLPNSLIVLNSYDPL